MYWRRIVIVFIFVLFIFCICNSAVFYCTVFYIHIYFTVSVQIVMCKFNFRAASFNKFELSWVDDERQLFKTAKRSRGTPQAPGDATVLKRFFRDNFIIFRQRLKRIAFWNQWIFLRVSLCKLSIFVMVTWPHDHFSAPSAKCLVTDSPG